MLTGGCPPRCPLYLMEDPDGVASIRVFAVPRSGPFGKRYWPNRTSTGLLLFERVPSPSWPSEFRPQHMTPLFWMLVPKITQAWLRPTAISVAAGRSTTLTGLWLLTAVLSPSWP